jgi:hypothetical protein
MGSRRGACRCVVRVAVLLGALFALAPRPARGADHESERTTLYRQGVAAADAGHWATAFEKFRQVVAIRPAPTVLFSLAQAAEHLGRLATAENAYLQALADARQAGNGEVAGAAGTALAALTPRVPRLVVRVTPESATQVEASIDGAPVKPDTPVGVDPGEHLVVVRAAGMKELERRVSLEPRQLIEIAAALEESAPPPPAPGPAPRPAPPPVPAENAPAERTPFPVGLVVAGAGLAVGIAGLTVRLVEQSVYDSAQCVNAQCSTPAAVDRTNTARGWIIGGTVAVGVGVAAVVGGALLWQLGGPTSQARVGVTLRGVPGGAHAGLAGVF